MLMSLPIICNIVFLINFSCAWLSDASKSSNICKYDAKEFPMWNYFFKENAEFREPKWQQLTHPLGKAVHNPAHGRDATVRREAWETEKAANSTGTGLGGGGTWAEDLRFEVSSLVRWESFHTFVVNLLFMSLL